MPKSETKVDPMSMAAIHAAVQEVFLSLGSGSVEDKVLFQARIILGECPCSLCVIVGEQGDMRLFREHGGGEFELLRVAGSGIVGACVRDRSPVLLRDADAGFAREPILDGKTRCVLALPLAAGGQVLGAIVAESRKPDAFSESLIQCAGIFAGMVGAALRSAEKLRSLESMAFTDGLTGLYNIRYFLVRLDEEIARAARYGRSLSIVLVDLDDFKTINDRFGHLKGDEALRRVAAILTAHTRKSDSTSIMRCDGDAAARYGGDEFMILLPETPREGAEILADRLRNLVSFEIPADGDASTSLTGVVTASLGVASMQRGESAGQLIARADAALYEAKRLGKNRVVVG